MRTFAYILLPLLLLAGPGYAQTDVVDEVESIDLQLPEKVEAADIGVGDDILADDLGVTAETDKSIQEQPTTNVEATPLAESKAEAYRRARQDAEAETEQKIVETLEKQRMQDEEKRRQSLLGSEQTVRGSMDAEDANKGMVESFYVSGILGATEYPDASFVDSNISSGLAVGAEFSNKFIVEGAFIYSRYEINYGGNISYLPYKDLDQYNWTAALKYPVLSRGTIRGLVGGVASYTYRKYADIQTSPFAVQTVGSNLNSISSTDAFDMGILLGVDFDVAETFAVGLDYRYMINISSQRGDLDNIYSGIPSDSVEELNYYTFGLNGKIRF